MTKNIALCGFIWNIAVSEITSLLDKMVKIWSAKYIKYLNLNLVYAKIWLHCVQLSLHIFYLCNSKVPICSSKYGQSYKAFILLRFVFYTPLTSTDFFSI